MGKRVGDASRTVFRLSGQWPWDLTSDFSPKKWGIKIVESLRKLLRIVHRRIPTVDYGHNFQVVKDYLQDCTTKRNARHPHLKNSDVIDACDYFSVDNYRGEAVQTTTGRTRIRRITTLLRSGEDNGEDRNSDEDYEDHSDGENDSHEVSAEDEWEDWVDYDRYTEDDETAMGGMVPTGKRSRSSSVLSRAPKRACTIDSNAAVDETDDLMSLGGAPSPTEEVNPISFTFAINHDLTPAVPFSFRLCTPTKSGRSHPHT
jgi:hypothetical protein